MIQPTLLKKWEAITFANELKQTGVYPYFPTIQESEGPEVLSGGKRLLMFGSHSYLGLATHPKVKEAAKQATERFGTSCSGSRFLNGITDQQERLEQELAAFLGKEDALVFSTGLQTNLEAVGTLLGRHGVLLFDEMNYASSNVGRRLSYGRVLKFRHNDHQHLEQMLSSLPEEAPRMIVVDGVFGMGGDICPLPAVVELANKYGAMVMVNDAHALGVIGQQGRGTASHFGVTEGTDIISGSLSKSLASMGGFVAANSQLINYLRYNGRNLLSNSSIPPASAAAARAALQVMQQEPERIDQLWANACYLTNSIREMGFDTGNSASPIIPIYIRDNERTFLMNQKLLEAGILVNMVVAPAVPGSESLLRLSVMSSHTREQIDLLLHHLKRITAELGILENGVPAR